MVKSKYHTPHDPIRAKARKLWEGMHGRCYNPKEHLAHPTYVECEVAEVWHDFENFYPWFLDNYIEGYCLDKDLTILGNKIYAPDTCAFIPRWLNNLLLDSRSSRGLYPIGVSKDRNSFKARFSCNGVAIHLGTFKSVEEASNAYQKAKGSHLISCATNEGVPLKIKENLIRLGKDLLGEE